MKGPSTEGIFRKAANEKARKELKEDLNKGMNVDLKSKSVHLLAVVLKVSSSDIGKTLLIFTGPLQCQSWPMWDSKLKPKQRQTKCFRVGKVWHLLFPPDFQSHLFCCGFPVTTGNSLCPPQHPPREEYWDYIWVNKKKLRLASYCYSSASAPGMYLCIALLCQCWWSGSWSQPAS